MNDIEQKEFLSLGKYLGEIAIDTLIKDGLFKDIPIIGTTLSAINLIDSISDRILLEKIIHFIHHLNCKNEKEIDQFKQNYLKNNDYKKIGSKILFILDKADDINKIEWLSKSLILLVDGEITESEFLRLASIINRSYTDDIKNLNIFNERNSITSYNDIIETYILDHLFSIGLLENNGINGGDFSGINSGIIYNLNKFGIIMKDKIIK